MEPDALSQITSHAEDARYTTAVLFYAPWCPHCQHFAPKYEVVGEHFAGDHRVRVAALDCVAHHATCGEQGVKGFPTMKVFHALGASKSLTPEGHRLMAGELNKGAEHLIAWIEGHLEAPRLEAGPGGAVALATGGVGGGGGGGHSWGAAGAEGHARSAPNAHAHEPLRPSVRPHPVTRCPLPAARCPLPSPVHAGPSACACASARPDLCSRFCWPPTWPPRSRLPRGQCRWPTGSVLQRARRLFFFF